MTLTRRCGRHNQRRVRAFGVASLSLIGVLLLAACGAEEEPSVEPDEAEAEGEAPEGDEELEEVEEASALAETLDGEPLEFIVGYGEGGGFDQYARMLGPFLERELGVTVAVHNEPGAGGLVALNGLATRSPEQPAIVIANVGATAISSITDPDSVTFDLTDLSLVGRVGDADYVWVAGAETDLLSVEDVEEAGTFSFGSTGVGASDYLAPQVLDELFDFEAELIPGFDGHADIELAVIRGEMDGFTTTTNARLPAIQGGDVRPLLRLASDRHDEFSDVPTWLELEQLDDDQLAVAEFHTGVLEQMRVIVAQPGLGDRELEELRSALEAVVSSDELLQEAEDAENPINYLSAQEVAATIEDLLEPPEDYLRILEELEPE